MSRLPKATMTDYPANKKSSKKPVWAKMEAARKWRAMLAIFICLFLGFFIINGILRAFSLKKYVSAGKWNGGTPYVAAISTSSPAVLVFNRDLAQIVVLKVPGELNVPTGEGGSPLLKVKDINAKNGEEMTKVLTKVLGLDIQNYAVLKESREIDQGGVEKAYGDFVSFSTLARIVTVGSVWGVESTNITRIDLLRLWWQVKSSGIKSPKIIDLGQFTDDVVAGRGVKIESLDRELFHLSVNKYFAVRNLADQNIKLVIRNSSGAVGVGQLAGEMVASVGFNVIHVNSGEPNITKCNIQATSKNSQAVSYLANVFKCDIVAPLPDAQMNLIILDLGSDFAKRLF